MIRLSITLLTIMCAFVLDARSGSCQSLVVGFEAADTDKSGGVSSAELKTYLADRLRDDELKYDEIFDHIDTSDDGQISGDEFEKRHGSIEEIMGADYFGEDPSAVYADPGKDFAPYRGEGQPTNDAKIMGAVIHRFADLSEDSSVSWTKKTVLQDIPSTLDKPLSQAVAKQEKPSVDDLAHATVVLCGGDGMGQFTAGAVLISEDGLAVTNYHVAEFLSEGKMAALTTDGKCYPVVEFLAGNLKRDVALIRIQGSEFKHVRIASTSPRVGDNLEMLHHSENRFYTYDRGYVMRYPVLGDQPWMEISADYAPGGSGCGIFNSNRELVGLVSIIQYGDGPSLAIEHDMESEGDWSYEEGEEGGMQPMDATLMMKHAVPLSAIQSLWKEGEASDVSKKENSRTQKVKRELQKSGK